MCILHTAGICHACWHTWRVCPARCSRTASSCGRHDVALVAHFDLLQIRQHQPLCVSGLQAGRAAGRLYTRSAGRAAGRPSGWQAGGGGNRMLPCPLGCPAGGAESSVTSTVESQAGRPENSGAAGSAALHLPTSADSGAAAAPGATTQRTISHRSLHLVQVVSSGGACRNSSGKSSCGRKHRRAGRLAPAVPQRRRHQQQCSCRRQAGSWAGGQAGGQTTRQAGRRPGRQVTRQANGQAGKPASRSVALRNLQGGQPLEAWWAALLLCRQQQAEHLTHLMFTRRARGIRGRSAPPHVVALGTAG